MNRNVLENTVLRSSCRMSARHQASPYGTSLDIRLLVSVSTHNIKQRICGSKSNRYKSYYCNTEINNYRVIIRISFYKKVVLLCYLHVQIISIFSVSVSWDPAKCQISTYCGCIIVVRGSGNGMRDLASHFV